jgi:aminodeoxyfutalosine synthase
MDATFEAIREKVERAERLSAADGEFLLRPEVDLHRVGELADAVRRRMAGEVVFYNVNAHLNPTNVCFYRCALCAYSRDPDDPRAFVMSDEQMLAVAREAAASGATELHIVGGVHPGMEFAWYRDIIARLHEAQPGLHLKAWTAVEIDWFAQQTGRPARAVLEELMRHGLGSLPGGGAEILDPEVRSEICPRKADAETWLAVHRGAHSLGLPTNATMLFGHIESHEHRVDHLLRLRHLQDETGGFQAFVPLVFHPENTRLGHVEKTSADDVLRTVAVSRLMLDNIPHIKAYWVSLGLGVAQTALSYGANDLDGTVRREQIHHAAGATSPDVLGVEQLRALIAETGRRPVERDSLYRPV